MPVLIQNARVLTLAAGELPRRGVNLALLSPIDPADVLIDAESIAAVEPVLKRTDPRSRTCVPGDDEDMTVIDAAGRVLMPAFIDAHTHALWAGDRLDEWENKLRLASRWPGSPSRVESVDREQQSPPSYVETLKSGGGIMSTVRAVRDSTPKQLTNNLRARLAHMLREGTTTVEVKSGYGLTTKDEIKMLRAIREAARYAARDGQTVVATALLGHAIDPDQPDFVRTVIEETLPAVHAEFPDVAIDAYCETGAWSLDDCRRLFERALDLGHPIRVHADQFNSLGMTRLAVEMGALSVDHLEATTPSDLELLARSQTFGVMLPPCGFHLALAAQASSPPVAQASRLCSPDRAKQEPPATPQAPLFANARAFVDSGGGGALVLATNCNPGSAPTSSMPFAIALAVRRLGLTPAEAIVACTVNAAALLGFTDRAVIAPGKRADLVLLRHTDERLLAHDFGGDPTDLVIAAGQVREKTSSFKEPTR